MQAEEMILKQGMVNPTDQHNASLPAVDPLIERAKNGDDESFGQLVAIYEKFVYNTACRILTASGCGISDAEDISQASFIKAWRSLSAFRGECTFSTWLYRITINTAKDYIRSHIRHGTVSLTVESDENDEEKMIDVPVTYGDEVPEDAMDKKETISAVREAIEQLPEDQKNVIVLRDIHELPYSDISAMLGIEIGTVKSRINRGRQALKTILIQKKIF